MKASFFSESLLYYAVRGVGAVLQTLPATWALGCGRALGMAGYWAQPARRAVCLGNLTAALGAERSPQADAAPRPAGQRTPAELDAICREVFRQMGMSFVEMLRTPVMDAAYVDRWIRIVGRERFDRAIAGRRGLILLTAHFGNWELTSITAGLKGYPISVLVRQQGLPRLNQLLNTYRESKGCRVITKGMTVRAMIRELRGGGAVGILADQDAGRRGVLAPFFGRLASTARGPIALAVKMNCPILPVFIVRTDGPAHTIYFEPPLALDPSACVAPPPAVGPAGRSEGPPASGGAAGGGVDDAVQAGIAEYLRVLERYVRRTPTMWFWPHRRWKSSPHQALVALSDGKAGHRTQVEAVATLVEQAWTERLAQDPRLAPPPVLGPEGRPSDAASGGQTGGGVAGRPGPWMTRRVIEVRYRSAWCRAALTVAAATGVVALRPAWRWLRWALTRETAEALERSWATITISCGAAAGVVNALWGRSRAARTIHVMRPPWPFDAAFDLRIVPRHDRLPADARTLVTTGALHAIQPQDAAARMTEQRRRWSLACPTLIGVLVGGHSRGIRLPPHLMAAVAEQLTAAAKTLKAELLITTSRRTPPAVEMLLEQRFDQHSLCPLLVLASRDTAPGYVPGILAAANVLVVSADSMSMVSEAAASGKPVLVFEPVRLWPWPKYRRFLASLADHGAVQVVRPEGLSRRLIEAVQRREPVAAMDDRALVLARLRRWL